eukprot:m.107427 g.107427  ORF g.107427 m.107427 type:complete len:68 (-) comp9174_c1_seq2:3239-3442(-)
MTLIVDIDLKKKKLGGGQNFNRHNRQHASAITSITTITTTTVTTVYKQSLSPASTITSIAVTNPYYQ